MRRIWRLRIRYTAYFLRCVPVPRDRLAKPKPIFAYVEYFGPAGDYEVWIDLVRLEYDEVGEQIEVTNYGPFALFVPDGKFVHRRYYCLRNVPLSATGLHEFQLRIAGAYHTIITRTLFVED